MLGERLGHIFDRPLGGIAKKIPVHPNTVTITGFLITVVASIVLVTDLRTGGILVLAGGLFDILDGVVARANNKRSRFGAFLDSVLDRYSDAFILIGLGCNLFRSSDHTGVLLCVVILVGSFLISYARARAEGLGERCNFGLLERPERIVLISFAAITGFIAPVLWLMAVLTHVTVVQRIYVVSKSMAGRTETPPS